MMSADELAELLKDSFFNAGQYDRVRDVNLFGIRYAEDLTTCGVNCRGMIKLAGLPEGYAAELAKGIRLASVVIPK